MNTKTLNKVAAAVVIAILIVIVATVRSCEKPEPVDPLQSKVQYLQDSIAKLNDKIMADSVEQARLSVEYNRESTRADSLAKVTANTVIRYREVRGKTDTVAIIVAADSLAIEADSLAKQVLILTKAADSLIQKGIELQKSLAEKSAAYQQLDSVRLTQIEVITKDRDYWKKLAERRGRKIEW